MALRGFWEVGVLVVVLLGRVMGSEGGVSSAAEACSVESVVDLVLGFRDWNCLVGDGGESRGFIGVVEGDEVSLQRALNMVHKNSHKYVAVLFHASWCPFSATLRPSFSILSSLYPSIPHFAIEESAIRPSILSKYGVHGFPTVFLLNSTMRIRYHGSRTLGSFISFYSDITGINTSLLSGTSLNKTENSSNHEEYIPDVENCPFSWAKSPEKILRQETYLALATAFVLLRSLYLLYPTLVSCIRFTWRRLTRNIRLWVLSDHLLAYTNRAGQLFSCFKEPCKRSNLQEGALNARAWASKSLATVSIGDSSSGKSSLASDTL